MDPLNLGQRLQDIRTRRHFTLRALSRACGLAPSFLSAVEAGKSSPSVASLIRILEALQTPIADFFQSATPPPEPIRVIRPDTMRRIEDGDKSWRYPFPELPITITSENYSPRTRQAEEECHPYDLYGLIISGRLTLQTADHPPLKVRTGEWFAIRAGVTHRASNPEPRRLHLITFAIKTQGTP